MLNVIHNGDTRIDSAKILTHEAYLRSVRELLGMRLNAEERSKVLGAELLYGAGETGVYGACYYGRWSRTETQDVIEISAFCEESLEQLWVTVAHECGHVLAGYQAGHGPEWKAAAKKLGLVRPIAVGEARIEDLDAELVAVLRKIPSPEDGNPLKIPWSAAQPKRRKPCGLGIGRRGGKSRGAGSGRLRLYVCRCPMPVKVRVASDEFQALCLVCDRAFYRVD